MLAKDLDTIAQEANDPDIEKLCELIRQNYDYPVDSVLISKAMAVLGHVNVNQLEVLIPSGYLAFLRKGLQAAGVQLPESDPREDPGVAAETPNDALTKAADVAPNPPVGLTLTREHPSGSLLEIARHDGNGQPGFGFYTIDTRDFADGGTIEITVRVGGGDATTRCEFCGPEPQNPEIHIELGDLNVAPGESKTIKHPFEKGELFSLVVKAASQPGAPPQASPLLITVSVK